MYGVMKARLGTGHAAAQGDICLDFGKGWYKVRRERTLGQVYFGLLEEEEAARPADFDSVTPERGLGGLDAAALAHDARRHFQRRVRNLAEVVNGKAGDNEVIRRRGAFDSAGEQTGSGPAVQARGGPGTLCEPRRNEAFAFNTKEGFGHSTDHSKVSRDYKTPAKKNAT